MNPIIQTEKNNLPDVAEFIETLKRTPELFDFEKTIFVTRAPGRLDVMGGIADYSGSLVLEMPVREAALVALQKQNSPILKIVSRAAETDNRTHLFEMDLTDFKRAGKSISYADAGAFFRADSENSWAAYIAGAFLVLMREKDFYFECGATIVIDSKVPEGKGVSSSAAIEIAAMQAIAAAFEIEIETRELAILCQKVENLIVGAPCGIMDQMSSAAGFKNQLLSMICQPAELREFVSIPPELAVWGIDSGVRHSVGAGDYGSVRTGAFIGYRIIADVAGLKIKRTETDGIVEIADEKWHGYLANISPEEFEKNYAAHLPKEISGAEFLAQYQGITDRVTKVLPDKNYAVFYPTAHPVEENFRVHKFAKLLREKLTEKVAGELGKLMFESHESYSRCGLGTKETDLLVELIKKSPKLYGAKITGGGSGGTVAVLGEKNAANQIQKIAELYERQIGYRPYIFSGSSMGAAAFGHLEINLRQ